MLPFLLLGVIVIIYAWWLRSEFSSAPDCNDNILHATLINGMENEVRHGRNPFDFWLPEIALGMPLAKFYQIGGHALVVGVYYALFKTVPLRTVFVWMRALAIILTPVSFFFCARLLGMPEPAQVTAAGLSLLVSGDAYGIDLGSYARGGHGIFPQSVATHFFLLAIGFGWQTIRFDWCWWIPAVLIALTLFSNVLYGWAAALTLCFMLIPSPTWPMAFRLAAIGILTGALVAPKLWTWARGSIQLTAGGYSYRNFMLDSHGATKVVKDAISGDILDLNRFPSLTIMTTIGIGAGLYWPNNTTTFVLVAVAVWVALYFGRPFWGRLLYLVGGIPSMQLHRLIGPVQIFAVLVAAIGVGSAWGCIPLMVALFFLLAPAIQERRTYCQASAQWTTDAEVAFEQEGPDVMRALAIAKERGGRAYAGMPSTWGMPFGLGHIPFYCLFPVNQINAVGFLYIGLIPRNTDMYNFDETQPADYDDMDVRTVIAPADKEPLPGWELIEKCGRFWVYGVNF